MLFPDVFRPLPSARLLLGLLPPARPIVGDLVESVMKRSASSKDSGSCPGRGESWKNRLGPPRGPVYYILCDFLFGYGDRISHAQARYRTRRHRFDRRERSDIIRNVPGRFVIVGLLRAPKTRGARPSPASSALSEPILSRGRGARARDGQAHREDVGLTASRVGGLRTSIAALLTGKDLALANKETIVMAGPRSSATSRSARRRASSRDS
jgi:hypothetical protein